MNFLYKIYFGLPNFARIGYIGKVINYAMAFILKRIFDLFIPSYYKRTAHKAGMGINTMEQRDCKYIVSITSFPGRIDSVWITLETILRQTFKPDAIILWLGKDQFANKELPESLISLKKRGITIEFREDVRSHTKYFYALQEFSDACIITLDDDNYYDKNTIKHLVDLHCKYPTTICANRVHRYKFKNNQLLPYRQWYINSKSIKTPSNQLFITGVGGVLYPPKSFDNRLYNKEEFRKICYFADDVWLSVCALLNGSKVVTNKAYNKDFLAVSKSQNIKLNRFNVATGGNDEQIKAVCEYYNIDIFTQINKS